MPISNRLAATLVAGTMLLPPAASAQEAARSVVLLHGATMDGSVWRPVHDTLRARGFAVSIVQLPLTSLEADVAAARQAIARQDGDVVLVGHSYGGAVASVAGADPKVRSLVFVAAFQPDVGESVADLGARAPLPGHPVDLGDGTMIVDPQHYAIDIAGDLPAEDAAFLAASQKPTAFTVYTTKLSAVAWHDKPSFGVVATQDRTLDARTQRFMYERSRSTIIEIDASHVPHLSQPKAVADVVVRAAAGAR